MASRAGDPGDPGERDTAYELFRRGSKLLAERHPGAAAVVLERASNLEPGKASILEALARKNVVRAIKAVSEGLGNTPAVSRSAYVHPEIIDAYIEGDLQRASSKARSASTELQSLRAREVELVTLLRRRRRRRRQAASASKRSSARR